MDVSSDLTELSRTSTVVVCAGVKSVLDVGRTLEVLETLGVPVCSLGTWEFPGFFSESGCRSPGRVESVEEAARAFLALRGLGMGCGMMVAVPNPHPGGKEVEEAVRVAVREA